MHNEAEEPGTSTATVVSSPFGWRQRGHMRSLRAAPPHGMTTCADSHGLRAIGTLEGRRFGPEADASGSTGRTESAHGCTAAEAAVPGDDGGRTRRPGARCRAVRRCRGSRPGPTSSGWSARTTTRSSAPMATPWPARPLSTRWRRRACATNMPFRTRRSARRRASPHHRDVRDELRPGAPHARPGASPTWLRGFPEFLRDAGYYCTNNAKTDYNATIDLAATGTSPAPTRTGATAPTDAPFFAVFNFMTYSRVERVPGDPVRRRARPRPGRRSGFRRTCPTPRRCVATWRATTTRSSGWTAGRRASRRARCRRARRRHHRLLLLRQRRRPAAQQALLLRQRARTSPDRALPREVGAPAPAAAGLDDRRPVSCIDLAPDRAPLAGLIRPAHMQGARSPAPARSQAHATPSAPRPHGRALRHACARCATSATATSATTRRIWPTASTSSYAWGSRVYREWERLLPSGRAQRDPGSLLAHQARRRALPTRRRSRRDPQPRRRPGPTRTVLQRMRTRTRRPHPRRERQRLHPGGRTDGGLRPEQGRRRLSAGHRS